jgi:hypothetical protein
VLGGGADPQFHGAGLEDPVMHRRVVITQLLQGNRNLHDLGFSGLKADFVERAQSLERAFEGGLRVVEIDLEDFSPGNGPGIREFHGESDCILRSRLGFIKGESAETKGGVGEPEAEGELGGNAVFIVMAVSHEEPLVLVDIDLGRRGGRVQGVPPFVADELAVSAPEARVGWVCTRVPPTVR